MTLFGTAGIRGPVTEVTPDLALAVGRAVGRDAGTVVIGRDGRETGPALAAAVEAGAESTGATVRRVGQVPTPALAYASRGRHGVMLTASHNPPADNGIKLFADGEEFDRDAERRVERRVAADDPAADWDEWGDGRAETVLPDYRAAVVDYVREAVPDGADAIAGTRVAVDCGTGVGALATPQVLRALGADVVALNATVDGHFPARASRPTAKSLSSLRTFVADGDVALGIGHDGDADRFVVVDADGAVVHEETVLAIVAAHYTRQADADDPVAVTTPNASARIDDRVAAASGRVARVRLGALHEGIARERAAGGDVVFAAEPWKHVHPAFGGWIDGVASAAVVAALTAGAGGIESLREPVDEPPKRRISVECPDDAKAAAMDRLADSLPVAFDGNVNAENGVRIDRPDGSWLLVRPSGTEPYVRIYAEGEDVDAILDRAREVVADAVAA